MKITKKWLKDVLLETGHHPMGPSGAVRWMTCPGSVSATAGIPDQPNEYAIEGTKAHELGEYCLVNNVRPEGISGYSDEMQDFIGGYVDYVKGIVGDGRMFIEQDLNLSHLIPECHGTADVVYFTDKELGIIDLKYGMGKVTAESPQLKIYLSGAVKAMRERGKDFDSYRVHIYQPRNGGASSVEVSQDELADFENEVSVAAQQCFIDNAPLVPSDKGCEWCRAKNTCSALYEHTLEVVGGDFDILPDVSGMTDEQLRLVLENKSLIEKWLKGIESEVFSRLTHGEKFEGFKMVEGRSLRKWTDNAPAILGDILGDAAFEKKLLGIGKIEKVLGKKHLEELGITVKPEGKPTLVPIADKRPAIGVIADDFSEI